MARAGVCHPARGKNRRRRHCGGLFGGGRGYPALYGFGGNPAKFIKQRFDQELTDLLLQFRWWDLPPQALVEVLPLLCDPDLEKVRAQIKVRLAQTK